MFWDGIFWSPSSFIRPFQQKLIDILDNEARYIKYKVEQTRMTSAPKEFDWQEMKATQPLDIVTQCYNRALCILYLRIIRIL
jgi:hypothetical protein